MRKEFFWVVVVGLGFLTQETTAQGLGRITGRLGRIGQPAINSSASISENDARQAREMEEDRQRYLMADSIRQVYRAERARQDSIDLANYLAEQRRHQKQGRQWREPAPSFPVNGSELDRFLWALVYAVPESNGNYDAKSNKGAYGKYQFMPSTWRLWSIRCTGGILDQTPENQERVARFMAQTLYGQYGRWRDVASLWFSGHPYSFYNDPGSISDGYTNLRDYCNTVLQATGLN